MLERICTIVLQNVLVCVVDPNSAYFPDLLTVGQLDRFTPNTCLPALLSIYSQELTHRTLTGPWPVKRAVIRKVLSGPIGRETCGPFQDSLQLGAAPGRFSSRLREVSRDVC